MSSLVSDIDMDTFGAGGGGGGGYTVGAVNLSSAD